MNLTITEFHLRNIATTYRSELVEKWGNKNWVNSHHHKRDNKHKPPEIYGQVWTSFLHLNTKSVLTDTDLNGYSYHVIFWWRERRIKRINKEIKYGYKLWFVQEYIKTLASFLYML